MLKYGGLSKCKTNYIVYHITDILLKLNNGKYGKIEEVCECSAEELIDIYNWVPLLEEGKNYVSVLKWMNYLNITGDLE